MVYVVISNYINLTWMFECKTNDTLMCTDVCETAWQRTKELVDVIKYR